MGTLFGLANTNSAQRWFRVMSTELGTTPDPNFSSEDLPALCHLRNTVEALYATTVAGDSSLVSTQLNREFSHVEINPEAHPSSEGVVLNLAGKSYPPHQKGCIGISVPCFSQKSQRRR